MKKSDLTEKQIYRLQIAADSFHYKQLMTLERAGDSRAKLKRNEFMMPLGDIQDKIKVCEFILNGDFKKAADYAYGMDTAAREGIPASIWKYLEKI